VAQVAAADAVQDQLQLMEQRMAEMEDRLQATSDELQTAKATVNEQRSVLSTNGLIEDEGLRSGVGSFFDSVDVSGVAAASFNYRLLTRMSPATWMARGSCTTVKVTSCSRTRTPTPSRSIRSG
jgi:hypothetical protein